MDTFNGMSDSLGLFHVKMLGNQVLISMFLPLFIKSFFPWVLSNTNNV